MTDTAPLRRAKRRILGTLLWTHRWKFRARQLSRAERRIAAGLLSPLKIRVVAWCYGIAPSTAYTYADRACVKFGVGNREEFQNKFWTWE